MPGGRAASDRVTGRRRLALAGAIAVLLVLALVALLVRRGDEAVEQVSSSASEPSSTVTTSPAAVPPPTSPSTTVAASTTSTAPVRTAPVRTTPTTARPTTPTGDQVETVAGAHGPLQMALAQARDRWRSTKPAAGYVWSYQNDCRCAPRRVEVAVDGSGGVTSVRSLDGTPSTLDNDQGLTVDAALAELQAAIDADAASIRARFDPANGVPSAYYIDRSRGLADEERGLLLLTFTPRS